MAQLLTMPLRASPFSDILAEAAAYLDRIACHLNNGEVISAGIRVSEGAPGMWVRDRVLRIGFYPVSADPFHWGHLLIGLSAIARFKLNKVVYVLSGSDERKPGMTPPGIRHPMGRTILNRFTPLFDYARGGRDRDSDGESSLFHLLALNPDQMIDAFYIAGSDHCRRIDPVTGHADTVQKLEENMSDGLYGFDGKRHRIFPVFVKRGSAECSVETSLRVLCMPGLFFDVSSTMIRRALAGRGTTDKLALLPHTAYLYIRALGLYTTGRRAEQNEYLPSAKRVA